MIRWMKMITRIEGWPMMLLVMSWLCQGSVFVTNGLPSKKSVLFLHLLVRSHILEFLTSEHSGSLYQKVSGKVDTVSVNLKSLILCVKEVYYTVNGIAGTELEYYIPTGFCLEFKKDWSRRRAVVAPYSIRTAMLDFT